MSYRKRGSEGDRAPSSALNHPTSRIVGEASTFSSPHCVFPFFLFFFEESLRPPLGQDSSVGTGIGILGSSHITGASPGYGLIASIWGCANAYSLSSDVTGDLLTSCLISFLTSLSILSVTDASSESEIVVAGPATFAVCHSQLDRQTCNKVHTLRTTPT